MLKNTAILLLGGNIGDTRAYFKEALVFLQRNVGEVQKTSFLYESEPWGFESNQVFLNQVVAIKTAFKAKDLLESCKYIERQMGRLPKVSEGYESRIIDIDILFFNEDVVCEETLVVPHPRLHLRRFTLMPLCDIIPSFIHPIFNVPVDKLLSDCVDSSDCWKIN